MADCSYTFKGPEGKYLTVTGIHGLKAYFVDGGLEHLFPERKFPLKAVAAFSREGIGKTINVDGIERPTTNSDGQLLHQTEDGIRNFWRWFGDSKVVDAEGRPKVVYHGTMDKKFNVFDMFAGYSARTGAPGTASFTDSKSFAEARGIRTIAAYLKASNPFDYRNAAHVEAITEFYIGDLKKRGLPTSGLLVSDFVDSVKAGDYRSIEKDVPVEWFTSRGFDAQYVKEGRGAAATTINVFSPNQIKSATGNRGTFSPEDADIRYSKNLPAKEDTFQNQAEAEDHLSKAFGPGIKNLVSKGVLKLTQSYESWPEAAKRQLQGGEEAVYYQGKIYINLAATAKDRMAPVLLHELGEHFNLEVMLGAKEYAALQNQITARAKIKGSEAEKVWNQVKELYPEVEVGGKQFISEVIAKLGENNPRAPWYRRILARIKAFLVERGLGRGFIVGSMTEADMHELLLTSLRSASGRFASDEARLYGGEAVIASRATDKDKAADTARSDSAFIMASRPAQAAGQVQESVVDFSTQLRGKLRKMSDKLFAQSYAFLSVRQMVEQSKEYLSNGREYEYLMQERRAEVDRWLIKGDRVVSEYWKKLSKTTRHALAEVMHKSTLADVDASKEWTGKEILKDEKGQPTNIVRVYTQSKLNKENQAWLDSIAGGTPDKQASASGRGYVDFLPSKHANADAVLAELRAREERQTQTRARNGWKDDNAPRKVEHVEAAAKFARLPEQAKYVYTKANELHNAMFRARLKALEEQINNAILDVATRSKLNKELRQKMESQGLSWYYAPLSRHGDHWFYGKDADGNNWFRTFESRKERDEAMEEFKKTGKLMGSGTSIKERKDALGNEVSDTFIREINEAISRNVPSEEGAVLQDMIYQMYIDTLPDVSVRHSAMHRKGVLGFDEDAMRSFSNAMHHGASQLANMIYGRQMEGVLNDAEEALTIASSDNQVQMRKEEIEAGDLLAEHWDVLAQKGYIENELRRFKEPSDLDDTVDEEMRDPQFDAVPQEIWAKMRELRNKFGRLDEDARLEALERHKDRINRMLDIAKNIKHEDKHKMAAVISELRKTYKAMVATNSSDMDQIAAYVKQFNFIWTLGFSLSSGLINMLQTPIVAMPIAYGKYGMGKTLAKFGESRNEFMKAIKDGLHRDKNGQFTSRDEDGNISISVGLERKLKSLTFGTPEYTKIENELRALDVFKNSGDISRTQTFELIGIGQEGEEHGGKLQDFSKWAGWIFHAGERANREITLMAGYRLARESGMGHEESIAEARRMNNLAHGDYSAENAARIFRGWPSQIALQYKKYTQMQLYLWGSTALNAIRLIKDRNSQEGREAARTLGGLFVMQSAFAGAMGLPLMGATTAIINAIGGLFDGEDEPFDVEDEIRVWIAQNFGEKAATAVMKGALNALTPANIGDRLSLRNIMLSEPMVELEGRDAATNYMASMFGPTGGTVKKLFEAGSLLSDGEVMRAAEMATPKFIADTIKAGRYFSEDAQTLNHQKLKDMTAMENMFQIAGFSSSRLEELYAERSMVKQREAAIREYRQKLLNDAVRAEEEGKEVDIDAIQAFNEKYPMKAIVAQSIARSEKTRNKYREESEDRGYAIDPKLEFLYEEYDLDDSED